MEFLNTLAAAIVVLAGIWLIGLATLALASPDRVRVFFGKFASSAFSHFLEMFLRLISGAAFVVYAPHMKLPIVFTVFGWILIATTAVLLFVPWRVHKRLAERSLPFVRDRMMLFGFVSYFGGLFILFSFFLGPDAL